MGRQKVHHLRSDISGSKPSVDVLSDGEIAINTYDEKLFFKTAGGEIAEIDSVKNTQKTIENIINGYATKTYVDNSIAELVDGAPETLDTLDELAAALNDNADIVDVLNQSISNKQDTIADLETIRQGAAKGATALQSYTEQYQGTVTGVKINGTTQNPSNGVVDLGTVITEHQTLKTINGESILGEGDLTVEGGAKVYTWNWDGSESGTLTQEEMNAIAAADAIQIIRTDEFALITTVFPIVIFNNVWCMVDVLSATSEISKRIFSFDPNNLTWETSLADSTSTDVFNITIVGENEDGSIQGAEGTFSHIYTNDIDKIAINGRFFSILYSSPQEAIAVSDDYPFGYEYESGVTGYGYVVIRITSDDVLSLQYNITFARSSDIPTKTSQLENDSNFVSSDGLKTINGESIVGSGNIEIGGNSDANVQAVDTSETLEDVNTSTYVKYVAQTLTDTQKSQARINIGVDLSIYATTEYVNTQIGDINTVLTSIINQ